jgi:hypothetical protein
LGRVDRNVLQPRPKGALLPAVSSEIWKLYQNGKGKTGKNWFLLGRPSPRMPVERD